MNKILKFSWQPALLGTALSLGNITVDMWQFWVVLMLYVFKD